ncbi:hypothetical protein KC345_g8567 [Hortaea werneckii]|nr:hypothetical protein KC345_g8567 [Hortaea werneckii]
MDEREVEIVDLTGDENPPPRQDRFGPQYPVATERSLGKRPAEPSSWEPLPKVRRAGYQNEQPPPGPSMSHGTVRQKMMTAPLEAGKRLHERARNDRSLREAMDALVAGTATAWRQALFERIYNEMMTQPTPMLPSLPPPHHLSSMRDKSTDRLLSVDGLVKCVLQQADGPAPNTPYGPQAQCVIDRLCFDLPRELFGKLRNREYGFPGLDWEFEEYDLAVESARRAVNSSWPGRELIPYTSAVETALAERYQQSKQTLKGPWTGLSHIETDSLDQAILPKSLKWIVRRSLARSKYCEDLNNAEFVRQLELRYRSEPEHNAILHATAQGPNLEHPSFYRLLDSALFHWTVIPEDDGIMRISETPLSESPRTWSWMQPMRPETPESATPPPEPWLQENGCPVARVHATMNFLREFKGQDIPDFEKAARYEDIQDDGLQNNSWVPWYSGSGRVEEESWSKQPIELGESSSSATNNQDLSERSSESRTGSEEDVVELQRPAQQSPSDTEDVREEQVDKSPANIDELGNEDLQILATRIKITRSLPSFTSSDPIIRELVVHANAEAGFAQTLDQVAQGNDNTPTKRTPLEVFRQAIEAIKQDIERPPAMRGLPEPLSREQWPLQVSPQYKIYKEWSKKHGQRIPVEKRVGKYLAHPDSFIQMHWKDHHDVAYPLTLLPKATWTALHNNNPHGALFLTAERLSWPRQTFGYKARTGIEEALWPVNFELGVEEPVQFSMHHDIFSAKKSVKNKNLPYADSSEAEMVMRVVQHAEILTDASWELWRDLDQHTTPMLSQSSTNPSTTPSSARPPLSEISDNARLQQTPLTPPSSATEPAKDPEFPSGSSSSSSMSLVEMYSSLDKIERSSPMASRFLEAYAEKLHAEVCRECWVETDVGGDDDGSEGVESEDEGEDEGEKAGLDVW